MKSLTDLTNYEVSAWIAVNMDGWKSAHGHNGYGVNADGNIATVPDYHKSLDLMYEIESRLDHVQWVRYVDALADVLGLENSSSDYYDVSQIMYHVSAWERAQALYLAMMEGAERS